MEMKDKKLVSVMGWIFIVWGLYTLILGCISFAWDVSAFPLAWLAGSLDMIGMSIAMGCIEVAAGMAATKYAGNPDKMKFLSILGLVLIALFALETFFVYTQTGAIFWIHMICGIICGALYTWAAWKE